MSSAGAFPGPASLKLLPLYTLALCKVPMLRPETGTQGPSMDERAANMCDILHGRSDAVRSMIYPRLFCVSGLADPAAAPIPPVTRLSSQHVRPDAAYLLEYTHGLALFLGAAIPAEQARALVGVDQVDPRAGYSLRQDTPLGTAVGRLVEHLRSLRRSRLPLFVIPSGSAAARVFTDSLVEDRVGGPDYASFFQSVVSDVSQSR
eukprot:gnl/Ergobibamus_cyprinoides/921.p1 GENE.gnl/Ergobibamus_cyprinoides/921~~gnl/Ergobibamus_cyprinoides/921.p1  ORF type:complete len:205 (+),score=37.03 gnl/Ergobibamus_cyprinoides/921:2-616(+)